jgi:hypothetical protein
LFELKSLTDTHTDDDINTQDTRYTHIYWRKWAGNQADPSGTI